MPERLDQPGLGQARHADQQRVAAGQQRDQGLLDHLALAENDRADTFAHEAEALAERVDLGDEIAPATWLWVPKTSRRLILYDSRL